MVPAEAIGLVENLFLKGIGFYLLGTSVNPSLTGRKTISIQKVTQGKNHWVLPLPFIKKYFITAIAFHFERQNMFLSRQAILLQNQLGML